MQNYTRNNMLLVKVGLTKVKEKLKLKQGHLIFVILLHEP